MCEFGRPTARPSFYVSAAQPGLWCVHCDLKSRGFWLPWSRRWMTAVATTVVVLAYVLVTVSAVNYCLGPGKVSTKQWLCTQNPIGKLARRTRVAGCAHAALAWLPLCGGSSVGRRKVVPFVMASRGVCVWGGGGEGVGGGKACLRCLRLTFWRWLQIAVATCTHIATIPNMLGIRCVPTLHHSLHNCCEMCFLPRPQKATLGACSLPRIRWRFSLCPPPSPCHR